MNLRAYVLPAQATAYIAGRAAGALVRRVAR